MNEVLPLLMLLLIEPPLPPASAAANAAVKRLGADDFEVRQKASKTLRQMGRRGHAALLAAVAKDGQDPEIVARAEEILRKDFDANAPEVSLLAVAGDVPTEPNPAYPWVQRPRLTDATVVFATERGERVLRKWKWDGNNVWTGDHALGHRVQVEAAREWFRELRVIGYRREFVEAMAKAMATVNLPQPPYGDCEMCGP